jgi:hypothetical protein
MKSPNVPGWHSEQEEAAERGTTLFTLRKKRRLGIGPLPVKYGRRFLYQDGGFAQWLEQELAEQQAAGERKKCPNGLTPPRRGRPRKNHAAR